MSIAHFPKSQLKPLGSLALCILQTFGLVHVTIIKDEGQEDVVECNNLTLINFILKLLGPMHEQTLTVFLLVLQVLCTMIAFTVRYPLAYLLFGEVVA